MSEVFLDFETRSEAELKLVGLHNYLTHKSTKVLMLAYAFGSDDVQLWEPHKQSEMPKELKKALEDPKIRKSAWNCAFERGVLKERLGIWIDYDQWQDPMASARLLSLPGSLDLVGEILGLPEELAKDKDGKRLLDIFSKPSKKKKKRGEEAEFYFRNWETDQEEWERFCAYCRRDVEAEREIQRRLKLLEVFPLPPLERRVWLLDAKINDRGIPVDRKFVEMALVLADREKQEAIEKQNRLTGLVNANSNTQLLSWARTQGYDRTTLNKGAVEGQLKYNDKLTPLCREVLEARKAASSTSYKKLSAILRYISSDGRLRNQFIYLGSARCGRWSGSTVQLHNLARPAAVFEDSVNVERARNLILGGEYHQIQKEFGSVLLTVKSNIRTAFSVENI